MAVVTAPSLAGSELHTSNDEFLALSEAAKIVDRHYRTVAFYKSPESSAKRLEEFFSNAINQTKDNKQKILLKKLSESALKLAKAKKYIKKKYYKNGSYNPHTQNIIDSIRSTQSSELIKKFYKKDSIHHHLTHPLIISTYRQSLYNKNIFASNEVLEMGIKISRSESLISYHARYAELLATNYAKTGRNTECLETVKSAKNNIDKLFLSIHNHNKTEQTAIKHAKIINLRSNLRCINNKPIKTKTEEIEATTDWKIAKNIYKSEAILAYLHEPIPQINIELLKLYNSKNQNLTEQEKLWLGIKGSQKNKDIGKYLPINTSLLDQYFDVILSLKLTTEIQKTKEILTRWHRNNERIKPHRAQQIAHLSNEALKTISTISRFERQNINAKYHYSLGDITNSKIFAESAISSIQKRWDEAHIGDLLKKIDLFQPKDRIDDLNISTLEPNMILGSINEQLGNFTEAAYFFDKNIQHAEKIRTTIPINFRRFFFESNAKKAYTGKYRNLAKNFIEHPSKENETKLLKASEELRSRQIKEIIQLDEQKIYLNEEASILILSELEDVTIRILKTPDNTSVKIAKKTDNWNKQIQKILKGSTLPNPYNKEFLLDFSKYYIDVNFLDTKTKSIKLVTDGDFSRIPISILPLYGEQPIGLKIDLTHTLSVYTRLNNEEINPNTLYNYFGVGDPTYKAHKIKNKPQTAQYTALRSLNFAQLPETKQEIINSSKNFKGEKALFFGENATETTVKSINLENYDILHFATHGVLSSDADQFSESALVFTPDSTNDGILFSSEVSQLKTSAKIAVLSACNTGSGKSAYGESTTGLARAFATAGVNYILVSLWPVDSIATQHLVTFFFNELSKGTPPSSSLRIAMQKVNLENIHFYKGNRGLKKSKASKTTNLSAPFYWAPFVLIKSR